jgi:hypothetical protein
MASPVARLLLLLLSASIDPSAGASTASMGAAGGKCISGGGASSGIFEDSMATTGWSLLRVTTSATAAPAEQAFAAGCVEAKLTVQQTHDYWLNYMREEYKAEEPPQAVVAFMLHQQEWLRAQMMDSANDGAEKRLSCAILYLKTSVLPRQAWDKHRESGEKGRCVQATSTGRR